MANKKKNDAPLSETALNKRRDGTPEDCIADLQRLAKAHPEKAISRNFYRVNGIYAESCWNGEFGTFSEFKRQAGIVLSRHAHQLEKHIAKHASKAAMRAMTEEKRQWEGKYERPTGKRFQTVLVASDIHDKNCDPFYRRLLLDTAKRVQPERVVLNGDIFDLPEFSKYTQDPRQFDVVGRIKWVHQFLEDLRKAAPDTQIDFVEGNHEARLLKHLAEATPALMTVLADLHGLDIPSLLGLDQYEVNFIARSDLSAFTESDIKKELAKNYVIVEDCLLFHHFPEGRDMGLPGANGHHHKHLVSHHYSPIFGPYEWHQTGSGHIRQASYCAGEKWSNGFLLCHVDTHKRRVQFEYCDVTHEHAIIGGKFHQRAPEELLPA